MHSFKGAENVYYNNNQPYTLAYGRPQLTARLRGEYRARKVSLEVEAQMQSVRHWTTYTSVNEKPSEPDSDSGLNLGRRVIGLYDFKVPVTVDLAARFNWFLSRKVTLFAEGRNLCDAKALRLGLLPRLRRGLYRRREVAVLSGGDACTGPERA